MTTRSTPRWSTARRPPTCATRVIHGKPQMRHRQLLNLDEDALKAKARAWVQANL